MERRSEFSPVENLLIEVRAKSGRSERSIAFNSKSCSVDTQSLLGVSPISVIGDCSVGRPPSFSDAAE
jgi:hypothetical protein